jgi:hypothetical protein
MQTADLKLKDELFKRILGAGIPYQARFPANPAVPADARVAAWGSYKADPANVADAGRLQKQAVMLMDRAGYR